MANHTPGPWTMRKVGSFEEFEIEAESEDSTGKFIVDVAPSVAHEANARLIAAAPDLLAVAKAAEKFYVAELEAIGGCDHPVNICCCGIVSELETLRDAIAKAEGK